MSAYRDKAAVRPTSSDVAVCSIMAQTTQEFSVSRPTFKMPARPARPKQGAWELHSFQCEEALSAPVLPMSRRS